MRRHLCAVLVLFVAGCAAEVDNADPDLSHIAGKADFDEARPITYGETATGQVNGQAFSLFVLDVEHRDRFEVEVRQTSGDFSPRSVVYSDSLEKLDHVPGSFEGLADGNKKSFEIDSQYATRVFVLVRADRYAGSGDFEIDVACIGGACAGDPINDSEIAMVGICLQRARTCALAQLDSAGITDAPGASALLAECLTADADCAPEMCDVPATREETPRALCDGVAAALAFYAQQSASCRSVFSGCMDECTEMEENSPYLEEDELDFWMTGEAICWFNRFGDSCDEYARAHVDCGGGDFREIDGVETAGTCFASWRASEGAWLEYEDDNIDCSHVCEAVETQCAEQCETDDPDVWATCSTECINDHPLVADDEAYVCDL